MYFFELNSTHNTLLASVLLLCLVVAGSGSAGAVNDEYYKFDIDSNTSFPDEIIPKRTPGIAGDKGRVISTDSGELVFSDGTPARFWGVNLTFSGGGNTKIPPPKEEVDVLINQLVQLGINHVRIIGLDLTAPEVVRTWLKKGSLHSPTLDKFHYLLYKLKNNNIYYSLSVNNSAYLILRDNAEVLVNKDKNVRKTLKHKHSRLFDEEAINVVSKWYAAVYGSINPYTKLSIAEDPANIFVTGVNEDSMFHVYYHNNRGIDDHQMRYLEKRFTQYLLKKYGSNAKIKSIWAQKGRKGLEEKELIERDNIKLISHADRNKFSVQRSKDTVEFYVYLDISYADSIKETLKKTGYTGLFSATQGGQYGTQLVNSKVSDYIDMHGYYDHPRRTKAGITLTNASYLKFDEALMSRTSIYRGFMSSLYEMPYFITEWNHSAWSDFAYEGPILQVVYSSFQGYPLLDAFTFLSHPNPDFKNNFAKTPLVVYGNGVLMALMPALSNVFLNSSISEGRQTKVISAAKNLDNFYEKNIIQIGTAVKHDVNNCTPMQLGFVHKIRKKLLSTETNRCDVVNDHVFKSDTGEITWEYGSKPLLVVDNDNVKIVAGQEVSKWIKMSGLDVNLSEHGAVVVVALDEKKILESNKLLVTIVQSSRNSDFKYLDFFDKRLVTNVGVAPVRMKNITARLRLKSEPNTQVRAIYLDGKEVLLNKIHSSDSTYDEFVIGGESTPWYIIDRKPVNQKLQR